MMKSPLPLLILLFPAGLLTCGSQPNACTPENHCALNADSFAVCDEGYTFYSEEPGDFRCYSPADASSIPGNDSSSNGVAGGIDFLGLGTHTVATLDVTVIATAAHGLNHPTALAFHPSRNELWVTNRGDDVVENADEVMTVISTPASAQPTLRTITGGLNQATQHFFASPAAFSFNQVNGTFATIHDTDKVTQRDFMGNAQTPEDFMGPTLWLSYDYPGSPQLEFNAGHGSHLDMLHHSPLGKGIAWEKDNVYWVFDGHHDAIVRYDFATDHGAGGSYHGDGIVVRVVDGLVSDVSGLPSHLYFEHATGRLFIANTGNSTISVLETQGFNVDTENLSAIGFSPAGPNYETSTQGVSTQLTLTTLVDGTANDVSMTRPSGLHLHNNNIIVSDNQSGTIFAFDSTTGALVDYLPLGQLAQDIMGVVTDFEGNLYVVDSTGNQVLRISVKS
jgi:DNA-binding beta-propeller fold protein YncE